MISTVVALLVFASLSAPPGDDWGTRRPQRIANDPTRTFVGGWTDNLLAVVARDRTPAHDVVTQADNAGGAVTPPRSLHSLRPHVVLLGLCTMQRDFLRCRVCASRSSLRLEFFAQSRRSAASAALPSGKRWQAWHWQPPSGQREDRPTGRRWPLTPQVNVERSSPSHIECPLRAVDSRLARFGRKVDGPLSSTAG